MARTAHSWYLHNTYIENNLIKPGKIPLMGEALDLRRITLDIYAVGAEKDHIVPWEAAWRLTQITGGTVRFILASSGHIAGIINPPGSKSAAYWTTQEGPPRRRHLRNGAPMPNAMTAAGGATGQPGSPPVPAPWLNHLPWGAPQIRRCAMRWEPT